MASNPIKLQAWKQRFKRFQNSSCSIERFCKNENVSVVSFYYWKKRLEENTSIDAALNEGQQVLNKSVTQMRKDDRTVTCPLEFRIEAAGVTIDCRASTIDALPELLRWAASFNSSAFQKLVVRS